MTDAEKISLIRDAIPVTQKKVYLNAGSIGPISAIACDVMSYCTVEELNEGRAIRSAFEEFKGKKAALRQAFAKLVNATPEEIALTHHATDGMNIVSHGLNWRPGDEVVTTNLEHPGGLLPLYVLRQRWGVVVKVIEIPPTLSPTEIVARFEAAITSRTQLLSFSHVAWNGMCLPLAQIVAMAHQHHVFCVADGAQAAGAIPLDLPGSGVDFYAMPGQKWLGGPEGTGALYVRREHLSLLSPTFVGYPSMGDDGIYDLSGNYMPAPDARRYEVATVYRPAIRGMLAHLTWLDEVIGWEWIHTRIAHIAQYAHESLSRLSGVSLMMPQGPQAGLVTFNLAGYDPPRVVTKLAEEDIILRSLPEPFNALRISTGYYNSEADIDRLIDALKVILKSDPESLPHVEH